MARFLLLFSYLGRYAFYKRLGSFRSMEPLILASNLIMGEMQGMEIELGGGVGQRQFNLYGWNSHDRIYQLGIY